MNWLVVALGKSQWLKGHAGFRDYPKWRPEKGGAGRLEGGTQRGDYCRIGVRIRGRCHPEAPRQDRA